MLNHHKNPHHTFMYVWIGGALLVLIIGMVSYALTHPRVVHAPETAAVEEPIDTAIGEAPQNSITLELGLNESVDKGGWSMTVVRIVEDSRCPSDVQCIQAGTVRVGVTLQNISGEQVLTLGERTALPNGEFATLVSVTPEKVSATQISDEDYRFALLLEHS